MVEYIFKDKIGYVSDEVSIIPTDMANYSEDHRIKFVTDLAAVSRGKDESNNPDGRYQQLLKEAAGNATPDSTDPMEGHASRVFEFLPVVLNYEIKTEIAEESTEDNTEQKTYFIIYNKTNNHKELVKVELQDAIVTLNDLLKFSYVTKNKIYTNMRAILNSKLIPYEDVPYNEPIDIKDFSVVKVKCPMFVWSQIMTHTQLTKVSQSDRVSESTDYWLPDDIFDRFRQLDEESPLAKSMAKTNLLATVAIFNLKSDIVSNKITTAEELKTKLLTGYSQEVLESGFKLLGYKREIYQRAMYYFKYKTFVMSGWDNNPQQWGHFFFERNVNKDVWKNWTQYETMLTVKTIAKVVKSEVIWELYNWADDFTGKDLTHALIDPELGSSVIVGRSGINLYNLIHSGNALKTHVKLFIQASHNCFKLGVGDEDGTNIREVAVSQADYRTACDRYLIPMPDKKYKKIMLYVNEEVNIDGDVTGYIVHNLELPEDSMERVQYYNSKDFYKIYGKNWVMKESDKKGYEQILIKYVYEEEA